MRKGEWDDKMNIYYLQSVPPPPPLLQQQQHKTQAMWNIQLLYYSVSFWNNAKNPHQILASVYSLSLCIVLFCLSTYCWSFSYQANDAHQGNNHWQCRHCTVFVFAEQTPSKRCSSTKQSASVSRGNVGRSNWPPQLRLASLPRRKIYLFCWNAPEYGLVKLEPGSVVWWNHSGGGKPAILPRWCSPGSYDTSLSIRQLHFADQLFSYQADAYYQQGQLEIFS